MKLKTIFMLDEIIRRGVGVDQVGSLFDAYTELEISCLNDVYNCGSDFHAYVNSRKTKLKGYNESFNSSLFKGVYRKLALLRLVSEKDYKIQRAKQERFVRIVASGLIENGFKNVLEIGSGAVGDAAIMLAQKGFDVTALDPELELSEETYKNLGVKAIKKMFNEDFDTSNFDLVIARGPCPSIYKIVQICNEKNIPFIIELCNCEPSMTFRQDWFPILNKDYGAIGTYDYVYSPYIKHNNIEREVGFIGLDPSK